MKRYNYFERDKFSIDFNGYISYESNLITSSAQIVDLIISLNFKEKDGLKKLAKYFNKFSGSWSLIIHYENQIIAAVDKVRTRPVFIKYENNNLYLSNNIFEIRNEKYFKIDKYALNYYRNYRNSPPGRTLIKNIDVLSPGYFLYAKNNKTLISTYIKSKNIISHTYKPSKKLCNESINKSFKLLKEYLLRKPNLNIYIPLSGGMDSRLIVTFLSKIPEIKERLCAYTYGNDIKSTDALISKQVATCLNIKWEFILYSKKMWMDLRKNFKNLILDKFPFELCSPNLQEYFAVQFMINKYGNGIFIPGYFLDVPAGNYICPDEISYISKIFRPLINFNKKEHSRETWYRNFVEKRITYVLMSCQWFSNYGSEFHLPFVENSILDFWFNLPAKYKKRRKLFKEIVYSIYEEIAPKMNTIEYTPYNYKFNFFSNEIYGIKSIINDLAEKYLFLNYFLNFFKRKKRIYDYLGVYNLINQNEFKSYQGHYNNVVKSLVLKLLKEEIKTK